MIVKLIVTFATFDRTDGTIKYSEAVYTDENTWEGWDRLTALDDTLRATMVEWHHSLMVGQPQCQRRG